MIVRLPCFILPISRSLRHTAEYAKAPRPMMMVNGGGEGGEGKEVYCVLHVGGRIVQQEGSWRERGMTLFYRRVFGKVNGIFKENRHKDKIDIRG